jgi:DnaJ-class molecular chaperone
MEAYQTLNLRQGAGLKDVKAAYRRLAKQYHPDTAGSGDAARFHEIHKAYTTLVRELAGGSADPLTGDGAPGRAADSGPARAGFDWRFEGVADKGLNVHYVLKVSPAAADRGLTLSLPIRKEDACPRCLGEGRTLAGGENGLHRTACARCGGSGVIRANDALTVHLTSHAIRRGGIRLKGRGRYQPLRGLRGDLVVETETARADGRSSLFSA